MQATLERGREFFKKLQQLSIRHGWLHERRVARDPNIKIFLLHLPEQIRPDYVFYIIRPISGSLSTYIHTHTHIYLRYETYKQQEGE